VPNPQRERYLAGKDLAEVARLIDLPEERRLLAASNVDEALGVSIDFTAEWHLSLLLTSLNRLVQQSRQSLDEERVNIFDEHKVNSFLRHQAPNRPLLSKLQASTYKTYKLVWKRLLCFVYRMIHQGEQPALHCVLTGL
jgi:hypothetical protein